MDKPKKNPAAVAMAKRRAASLTPERRREIALQAVKTRWKKAKGNGGAAWTRN